MRITCGVVALAACVALPMAAQESRFDDPFLDQLTGHWVMRGTIAGTETTDDVDVEWVLGHNYLRIHDLSRGKLPEGGPRYEAMVFIGWDPVRKQYDCLWLDITGSGGLTGEGMGHGKRVGDQIPFLFKLPDGSMIHNTFVYEREKDAWHWRIDNETDGKRTPFARVTLTRK